MNTIDAKTNEVIRMRKGGVIKSIRFLYKLAFFNIFCLFWIGIIEAPAIRNNSEKELNDMKRRLYFYEELLLDSCPIKSERLIEFRCEK